MSFVIYWYNDSFAHFYIELAFFCFVKVEVLCVPLLFAVVPLPLAPCVLSCHCLTAVVSYWCLTGLSPHWLLMVRLLLPLLKVVVLDVGVDWMLICNV